MPETEIKKPPRNAGPAQLFMLGLCLYVLGALAAQSLLDMDPETRRILEFADIFVCLIFLLDFAFNLATAPNRTRYFLTWGWLDLISSIPTVNFLRWGRAARIVRILRVLRGLRAARFLSNLASERRAKSAFWCAALTAILATVFASIAILQLEQADTSNITTAEEALWWSFVTVTTVGYGDLYPVTSSGRILAAVLMAIGIGLFGTLTAFVASAFLEPQEASQDQELSEVKAELVQIRKLLSKKNSKEL